MANVSKIKLPSGDTYDIKDSRLGNAKIFYGTCATAAGTEDKVVVCPEFKQSDLVKGALIFVTFDASNSATAANLTLNVNSTTAKPLKKQGNSSSANNLTAVGELRANSTYLFQYDGTNWVCMTLDYNSTYSALTEADMEAGIATTGRTITAARLKQAVEYWMAQNQSDWSETDTDSPAYIQNKPTNVSSFTNDAGYTTNIGTITGITMNGVSKGTSGIVDLGTVVTSDEKVKQSPSTDNSAFEVLLSGTADNTERTEITKKSSTLKYNPSTKALVTGGTVDGYTLNAAAEKAVDSSIAADSTSTNLPTSAAVASLVANNKEIVVVEGTMNSQHQVTLESGAYNTIVTARNNNKQIIVHLIYTDEYDSVWEYYMPFGIYDSGFNVYVFKGVEGTLFVTQDNTMYNLSNYESRDNKVTSWGADDVYANDSMYPSARLVKDTIDTKQDILVSGTNIKTINSQSVLGSGNISLNGGNINYTGEDGDATIINGDSVNVCLKGLDDQIASLTNNKQAILVSGTNIKTINDQSLLGSGNISVGTVTGNSLTANNIILGNGSSAIKSSGKKITTTLGTDDTTVPTSKAVKDAIDTLPEPMLFKGTLGTGGTITTLPAAAASNTGYTYKVITNGTYQSITAKSGDTFISNGSSWTLIPSGDEPSGTVTNIATGTGLVGGPITTTGTISIDTDVIALKSDVPTAVTEATVSGWGFTKNTGTVTSVKVGTTSYNPSSGVVNLPDYVPVSDYEQDEEVIAAAFNDVNDRLRAKQDALTIVNTISSESTNDQVPSAKAVYDNVSIKIQSSQPVGGFLPNVFYSLGELSGDTTFYMAAASDNTILNHWYWTFDTPSTVPTITWPAAITKWVGGSAPTLTASTHYEISVINGIAAYLEV